jgi:hypothetical protein
MASRAQVAELRALGHSYEAIGRELGIAPGLAFMIATGLPADGSEATTPAELEQRQIAPESTQQLVNPPAHNPTRDEKVLRWVGERAARELRAGS